MEALSKMGSNTVASTIYLMPGLGGARLWDCYQFLTLLQVVKGLWKPASSFDFSFFFLSTESYSCEKQSVRLRVG